LPIAGSTAQQASRHFPRLAHCRAVGGRQSHPASEAAGYIPGTPSRCQTTRRTPETSEDNQSQRRDALAAFPSLNAIRGTDVCEGDTHLPLLVPVFMVFLVPFWPVQFCWVRADCAPTVSLKRGHCSGGPGRLSGAQAKTGAAP